MKCFIKISLIILAIIIVLALAAALGLMIYNRFLHDGSNFQDIVIEKDNYILKFRGNVKCQRQV